MASSGLRHESSPRKNPPSPAGTAGPETGRIAYFRRSSSRFLAASITSSEMFRGQAA